MIKCDIREATHVQYHGTLYRIVSKWGVDAEGRLAKPSQGGFGCVTDTDERVSMWEAEAYFHEDQEKPFMSVWTVYYDPRDFPGKYVARRHDMFRGRRASVPSDEHFVADSLEEIRAQLLPLGLICLCRSEGDEPQIVETWL